ncbi:MAG: Undecaprenyl-diphosphatase [Acidimicrobiales bacterium]|nr:MAG: undecaprenyl-diphosphate phosphatase [Actinomycetota bacterium]MBV6509086.1 Undecaprenyl-diphosphatase [Acidimicrobiales bacterium]RIK03718.1 MAG: UDP-diphosphatase [Acidobacteriota bacterium]
MPILHAIVLGVVQGLTEFFPISSSGHLELVPWFFGWDDFAGDEALAKFFDVALHLGTLVGAVAYFWRDLIRYVTQGLAALFERREPVSDDGRIAWLLLLSAIPAAITGVVLEGVIESLDDEIGLIAMMLIVFGLVLYWADKLPGPRNTDDYRLKDSLSMGIGQALALQPGVSRSGVTISVGRYLGFDRASAARLSFLMSIPVIAGAGLKTFYDVATETGGLPGDFVAPFVTGVVTSAVTGYFAVWATIRLVSTHSFTPFVVYRVALGAIVLALLALGFNGL